jgi:hypothetical protein
MFAGSYSLLGELGGIEGFRRIEEALVPQRGIRECANFPLLENGHWRGHHSPIGRVENQNDPVESLSLLNQFRVSFGQ